MYCKNCGRQLKEGMRFCDRCGQSVRKNKQSSQAARHQEIEELKAERLNRKKRLAEKEAKQARNKQRKKKRGGAFFFIIVIVLIAIVSIIIGYNIFPNGSNTTSESDPNTDISTAAPLSTSTSTAAVSKNGYASITVGNVTCPYPSSFHSNTLTGNEKLNITDALGGATMVIMQEGKSGEPKDLMLEYAEQGGDILYSRAGDDWYAITAELNGTVNHRKCIIRNGIAVYYDFSYTADSSSAKKYEEYIEYIDSNFK